MNTKKAIQKILGNEMSEKINRNITKALRLKKGYQHDFLKFKKNAFGLTAKDSKENCLALITFHTHAVEKGLSHEKIRFGFGKNAIFPLLDELRLAIQTYGLEKNVRVISAVDALEEYSQVNSSADFSNAVTEEVDKWLHHNQGLSKKNRKLGGSKIFTVEQMNSSKLCDFEQFALNRHSVRNFSGADISDEVLDHAISIAATAPSVCNRQASGVVIIESKSLINETLELQGGLRGMGEGISKLLVITSDTRYFGQEIERNQPYVDGGIFSMNLLYGLEAVNVAACPLNADFNVQKEDAVKKLLGIEDCKCIILFVAVGEYKKENKVPISKRISGCEIVRYISEK